VLAQQRLLHLLGEAAVAPPVEGYRAAAVGNHEPERGEILEEVALDELHERGGVGVDVVRPGVMELGLHDELTWIIAGTSSSQSFS